MPLRTILAACVFLCFCVPPIAQAQEQSGSLLGTSPDQTIGAPPVAGDQATFDRGTAAYDRGDYATAYQTFAYLADRQDVAAMRNVALMKRRGLGTPRDPKGAMEYLTEAAEDGLPTAQADLADMLLDGEAGAPDPAAALPWLQAAAGAHHPLAQFKLAEIYERGRIVPRDLAKAEALYAEAAARGVPEAATRLNLLRSGAVSPPRP